MKLTQADQAADARIAAARSKLNTAIIDAVKAEPDTTYEELIEALVGVTYRYAQHLRGSDAVPVELPTRDDTTGVHVRVRLDDSTVAELPDVRAGDVVQLNLDVSLDLTAATGDRGSAVTAVLEGQ